MPAALLAWRPRAGEFTTAELVLHIANTRLMNLMRLQGLPHTYRGHQAPPETSIAGLLGELDHSSEATALVLESADLHRPQAVAPMGTGFGWQVVLGGLIEHEVHHRSQLCDYLSATAVVPPALFGLRTEDLPRP